MNGGYTFSNFYRSFVPAFPYIIIIFCYTKIVMTFRSVQRTVATHRPKLSTISRQATFVSAERRDRVMDQESSLTVTVAAILVSYLVCNIPANLILLLDPEATEYTGLHLPCYILAWMSSIVKAACYIACTANFRSSLKHSVLRIWKNVSVSNRSQNL